MTYKSNHWRDWIKERFGDESKYCIDIDEEQIEYTIQSTNPQIRTRIIFYFMRPDDDDVLFDIHFRGNDSSQNNIWMSPFTVDSKYKPKLIDRIKLSGSLATSLFYNDEFIQRLEKEWLIIPLQKGWTEEVNYVGNKIYRAKLRIKGNNDSNWNINTDVPFDLTGWDYLKTLLRIGIKKEKFEFEPIDK
jgi:hypothetical protein